MDDGGIRDPLQFHEPLAADADRAAFDLDRDAIANVVPGVVDLRQRLPRAPRRRCKIALAIGCANFASAAAASRRIAVAADQAAAR